MKKKKIKKVVVGKIKSSFEVKPKSKEGANPKPDKEE